MAAGLADRLVNDRMVLDARCATAILVGHEEEFDARS